MALNAKKFEFSRILVSVVVFLLSLTRCEIAFRTGQYGVTREMGFTQARKILGGLDAGSYIQGGLSLANGSFRDPTNEFIWELWPPGMSMLNFAFVKVMGTNSSPLIIWSLVSSLVIALLTYMLFGFLINQKKSFQVFGVFVIVVFLLSSATQGWLLDQGIMYAEGLTVLGLFSSLYFFGKYLSGYKLRSLVLSGTGITVAVFMRSVNLVIIYLLIACAILLLFFRLIQRYLESRGRSVSPIKFTGISTIVTIPIFWMLAWVSFKASWISNNRYQWVSSAANSWKTYWMRDSDYKGTGWEIVAGVDNWACQIDQAQCAKIHAAPEANWDYQALSIGSILQNPIAFTTERVPHFWDYWMLNGRWLYPPQSRIPAAISLFEGILFLFIFLFAIFLTTKIWHKKIELSLLQIAIILGNFLPLWVYHLEGRYFLPIKLISCMIILQNLQICNQFSIRVFSKPTFFSIRKSKELKNKR